MLKSATTMKSTLLAASLALSAFSLNAQATLTNYTADGVELVYSSVSQTTWTKDANLLGTMIANSTDANHNGTVDIIDDIILQSYSLNFTRPDHRVTASDFLSDGKTTWWGAMAFANYLTNIEYAGKAEWVLPIVSNLINNGANVSTTDTNYGYNTSTNGTQFGDELVELFYGELGGTARSAIPDTPTFDNENQQVGYWSSELYDPMSNAWFFDTNIGYQGQYFKFEPYYSVWVVSPGEVDLSAVSAVPEPENAAMMMVGLGLVGAVVRRRKQQA